MKQQHPKPLLIIALVLMIACKSNRSATENIESTDLPDIASSQLDAPAKCGKSDDGKYTLCQARAKQAESATVKFVVLEVASGELVYGPKSINGSVKWHSATQLRITDLPNYRLRDEEIAEYTYLFDLVDKKRIDANM